MHFWFGRSVVSGLSCERARGGDGGEREGERGKEKVRESEREREREDGFQFASRRRLKFLSARLWATRELPERKGLFSELQNGKWTGVISIWLHFLKNKPNNRQIISVTKLECDRCCLLWRNKILLSCIPPGNWVDQI